MSSFNKNASHSQKTVATVIDYDRQFQEDLERAQALSLESLALEKFRLQKQQKQYGNNHAACSYSAPVEHGYSSQSTSGNSAGANSNKPETDGSNSEK